jgi:hypothetical protein
MTGKLTQPPRRLAEMMRTAGGMRMTEALTAAAQRIEAIREPTLEGVSEMANELAAGLAAQREDRLREAHSRAGEITNLCGIFGLAHVSEAAGSLTGLLDAWQSRPVLDESGAREPLPALFWEASRVHAEALKTLLRTELPTGAGASIVDGLKRVAKRAMPQAPAPQAEKAPAA